ncbi:PAS domain-containing protein [Desertivirga brevis]|uniref:PAS domain-containing protein n=1 Tax=Desertivirga brevis TaxID=2810310 RepID=UPI001A97324B|nr:PAS domain S-box protein [Pedobacter sp. SYSU D00873]
MHTDKFFYFSNDLLCIEGLDGYFKLVNPAFQRTSGYSEEELLIQPIISFVHPEDRLPVSLNLGTNNSSTKIEHRFRYANGDYRWLSWSRSLNPEDNLIYTSVRDITEEKQLNSEVQKAALSRIKNLSENFIDGFILVDREYNILDYNERAVELLGLNDKVINGRSLMDFFYKLEASSFFKAYEKAFCENVHVKVAGFATALKRWFEVSAYPFENNLTIFFKDITDSKLRELNLKLEKSVLKMNTISDYSLKHIIDFYLSELTKIYPEMRLAVNLVNKKENLIIPLSSPKVSRFIDLFQMGFPIAPDFIGTCSTAVYYKKSCGFPDIGASNANNKFKEFAKENNINSCWSYPIINQKEDVLASVAVFYKGFKSPSEADDELIKRVATFTQIIIESHQTRDFLAMNIQRYKLVTQASKDAIYDWDILSDELYWGEGLEKIFGYRDSVTGLGWWEEKVHPDDLQEIVSSLEVCLNDPSKRLWNAEYRFLKADGCYAHIKEAGFILRDSLGKPTRMCGAMQDHTEIKEHQQQILKQNTVLREIARINSHYIRKPLANILALIQTIKAAEESDLKELIQLLELSGCELDEITRQIARKTYN